MKSSASRQVLPLKFQRAVTMVVRIACAQLMFCAKLVLISLDLQPYLIILHSFNSANILVVSLIAGSTAERGWGGGGGGGGT